jgi:intracellular multiplication protein IcmG
MVQEYNHDDVEYQLQDDEPSIAGNSQSHISNDDQDEKFQQMQAQAKIKRFISVIIMIVVVFFVGYRTLTFLFGHKQKTTVVKQESVVPQPFIQPVALPSSQGGLTEQQVSPDLVKLKTQLEKLSGDHEKLNENLTQQQDQNQNQFSDLNQQLSTITSNLSDIQKTMASMSGRIYQIEQAKKNEARRAANAFAAQQKHIRSDKKYYVQAVIPGRAWFRGVDGTAVTVAVGDVVPGYGRINSINSYSGDVATSLGGLIKYGTSGN